MTLNLNGGVTTSPSPVSQLLASPNTPKLCNLPSLIPPLTPTPIGGGGGVGGEKKVNNKNESVTVTHFSDLHGGVVEKISVPVTSSGGFSENGAQKTPTTTVRANNPFADEILTTTIITTTTSPTATTSPTIKISTNPFLRNSFNANERIDNITDKSVKISFAIGKNGNPFDISDASDEMNGSEKINNNGNGNIDNEISMDDVDNENNLSSISSVNMKIDMNNETNVTKIQMDTNGIKKVCLVSSVLLISLTHFLHIFIAFGFY